MLSSKSLIVPGLTFRSLIHSELSFVCGIRECSNLIILHIVVQFFQQQLLKRLFFLHCIVFPFLIAGGMGLFIHFLSCPIDLYFCFRAGTNPYWIIVSEVAQSCPTLCNPMDCSLSGSSVHGISQARVLEWIAISFSRGSSRPTDQTRASPHCRQMLDHLSQQGSPAFTFSSVQFSRSVVSNSL